MQMLTDFQCCTSCIFSTTALQQYPAADMQLAFSAAGYIISQRRNRLAGTLLKKLPTAKGTADILNRLKVGL